MKRRSVVGVIFAVIGVAAIAYGVYKLVTRKRYDDDEDWDYDDYDDVEIDDVDLSDIEDDRSYITVPTPSVVPEEERYVKPVLAEVDSDEEEELKAAAEAFAEDFYNEIFN